MTTTHHSPEAYDVQARTLDAVVVGAGFAGMYMLYRLRNLGMSVQVYEAGTGVGGTWYWNRYPGARCDSESIEYSYSFSDEIQQEWEWSERYPAQPEILRYADWVANKLDLKRNITFESRVTAAHFDETENRWMIETDTGDRCKAKYCIMATGCLSVAQIPRFEGLDSYKGKTYHTGRWPHETVDFTGQVVGVIGTGSSGIQSIPVIARQADHVYVFQRTPNYSVPAQNGPLDPEYVRWVKEHYDELRAHARGTKRGHLIEVSSQDALEVSPEERQAEFARRWEAGGLQYMSSYGNLLSDWEANESAAEFVRDKIREIVHDPEVAEKLVPTDYPIGTKRLCVDTEYYTTYNRANVTLVDVKSEPIERLTPTGLKTADAEFELDSIVFATGFDAMTGTLRRIDIRGRSGISLNDKWADGPVSYLGLGISGFPNLFTITGPGSPSVLSNMMVSIEQHVDWIADCLEYLQNEGLDIIEATTEAETEWTDHVDEVASRSLYKYGNSWWKGANVDGKPVKFMPYSGGVGHYRQICDEVAEKRYEGFRLYSTASASHSMASDDD